MTKRVFITAIFTLFVVLSVGVVASGQTVIHVGAFPNITHSQAMVGKANGWFEKRMGPKVTIDWKSFNAGPSAIEALFAGAIDMTYIGPNLRLCSLKRRSVAHRGRRDQRRSSPCGS